MNTKKANYFNIARAFIHNEFANLSIYRASFWLRLVYTFLMMYSVGYVWKALYSSGGGKVEVALSQIVTYAVLGVALEAVMHPGNGPQIYMGEQVRKGTIEMDIMKPIDFQYHMFFKNMGSILVRLFFLVVPSLVAAYFYFGFHLPTPLLFFVSLLSLAFGLLISFLLNFMLGLIGMVTMNIRNINWGYNAILRLFSGQMVPLWLFPGAVGIISSLLPFRCIYSIPMSIYIGNYGGFGIPKALGVQVLWVLALYVVSRLMMKRVFTKLFIQGG